MRLTLAQLHLAQGHVYKGCDVLRALGGYSYRLGVVSTHKMENYTLNNLPECLGLQWYGINVNLYMPAHVKSVFEKYQVRKLSQCKGLSIYGEKHGIN